MTPAQAAANARAVTNLADTLERWGLSDPERRAEHVVIQLLADGLAPLRDEPAPPPRGPGASRKAIDAAIEAAATAVREARLRRTTVTTDGGDRP